MASLRHLCGLASLMLALAGHALAADRPNAIIMIADDVSWNDFGCYGNPAARTPNIDRLAAGGLRFTQAYLTASSCSPSRSSIITGRYPHNLGKAAELHQPIAANITWFPTLLRQAGYYTAIVGKNHMTVDRASGAPAARNVAWDLVDGGVLPDNHGAEGKWVEALENRPKDKPFFFWFASLDAHRGWDGDGEWVETKYGPKHRPEDVVVPPFLADNRETRKDLASYYNEITRFDHFVGQVVKALEAQGQLDNTLIFVLADNGRPFPRAKTRLHDSGMKTALVAHWPAGIRGRGQSTESLASSIDLAPTILEAAGVKAPESFQGVSLSPVFRDPAATVRRYAFSEHNWHDYEAHGRSVRSDGFLYIRNARPALAWQGPADSVRSPSHQTLRAVRDAGKLTPAQADVFLAPRPVEELYRTIDDPDQLRNLASDPAYAEVKKRLADTLTRWADQTGDSVPEKLSGDAFDRETGKDLPNADKARGTPPGAPRNAERINHPGPIRRGDL